LSDPPFFFASATFRFDWWRCPSEEVSDSEIALLAATVRDMLQAIGFLPTVLSLQV